MLSGKAPQQYNQRQRQVAQLKPRDSRWTTAHVCVKCCQLVWVLVLPLTDSSTFSQQPFYSSPAFRHFLSWTLNVGSSLPILNSPFEAVRNSAQALHSTLSPTSSLLLFSSPHLVIDGLPEASRASETPPPPPPTPTLHCGMFLELPYGLPPEAMLAFLQWHYLQAIWQKFSPKGPKDLHLKAFVAFPAEMCITFSCLQ